MLLCGFKSMWSFDFHMKGYRMRFAAYTARRLCFSYHRLRLYQRIKLDCGVTLI